MAGHLVMSDPLREGTGAMLAGLRRQGIGRILLATGDRADVAERVTEGLGLDGLRAGLTPDQKVLLVLSERKHGPVMMVGDGVNDAPALAAADVGMAMGARGAAASAEAADVVLLVDRIDRLGPGIEIARASRRIAVESVVAGIGLSVIGMIAAAGRDRPYGDRRSRCRRSQRSCHRSRAIGRPCRGRHADERRPDHHGGRRRVRHGSRSTLCFLWIKAARDHQAAI
jgi:cation transport ATPase